MLIIFGTLVLKTIFSDEIRRDCNEFGHIHDFKIEKLFDKNINKNVIHANDESDSCHSAQTILNISGMPSHIFEWTQLPLPNVAKFNINIGLRFQSPDLEPSRKPPRITQ